MRSTVAAASAGLAKGLPVDDVLAAMWLNGFDTGRMVGFIEANPDPTDQDDRPDSRRRR
jgi:hypothetical protein